MDVVGRFVVVVSAVLKGAVVLVETVFVVGFGVVLHCTVLQHLTFIS